MKVNASIKDVAKKAGVSIGTVDRVLHNRGQVSEKTKELVQNVIDELKYQPNIKARSLAYKKKIRVGVLLPKAENKNEYWHYPLLGIRKARMENDLASVEIVDASYNLRSKDDFKKKISFLLSENPDGIITAPVYQAELLEYVHLLEKKDIFYALLDSDLEHSKRSFFIGQDPEQSGKVAAQLMNFNLVEKPADLLILHIDSISREIPTVHLREKGFRLFFEGRSQIQIHTKNLAIIKPDLVQEIQKIIKDLPHLKGIFVPDSKSHVLAKHLQKLSTQKPFIIGFDVLEENVRLLKEGFIDVLISQNPVEQGRASFSELVLAIMRQSKKNQNVILPIDIITSENVEFYKKSS